MRSITRSLTLTPRAVKAARAVPVGIALAEPWLQARPEEARRLALPVIDRALDGLGDKIVIFGVISVGDPEPETSAVVATRIRAALKHLPPERLIPPPDCGMRYIPRDLAFAKLKALAEGAAIVCRELAGS
jgi:methionine synthase II (cobalamin-independent)